MDRPSPGGAAAGRGPTPSAGAGSRRRERVARSKSISPVKKTPRPTSTAVAHGTISRWRLRVDEQHRRRGEREHPGPEQQRALLARPHRGQLVEGRASSSRSGRRRARSERSVRAKAASMTHHARVSSAAQRVDRAARGVDEAPVAARPPTAPPRPRRARDQERDDQAGGAERDHHCVDDHVLGVLLRPGRELRRALGDQAVALGRRTCRSRQLAGDDHLAAVRERVRHLAACSGPGSRRGGPSRSATRKSSWSPSRDGSSPGTTSPVSS